MAWFSFSKFKQCNNAAVHNAVKQGCEASNGAYIGGTYAFNGDVLVVSLLKSISKTISPEDNEQVKTIIRNGLPQEYKNAEFWEKDRFNEECPDKVKNATGYVSMFTPQNNKI